MKTLLKFVTRAVGALLMVAAVLQWLTFHYPDLNPLWPGAIFAPGALAQVLNWILVVVLGTLGWAAFTLGRCRLEPRSNSAAADSADGDASGRK